MSIVNQDIIRIPQSGILSINTLHSSNITLPTPDDDQAIILYLTDVVPTLTIHTKNHTLVLYTENEIKCVLVYTKQESPSMTDWSCLNLRQEVILTN
jgi:hypothetical protein